MAGDDGTGAGVQVAGAGVIAEPLPLMQHVVERRCGKRANVGKPRHESVKIRGDRDDRGLLQHDLAEPYQIGIGALARQRAPRQIAAMAVVPGEQCGRVGSRRRG